MPLPISRRDLLRHSALGAAALSSATLPTLAAPVSRASSAPTAPASASTDNETLVTGAIVDESSVRATVEVDASGKVAGSVATLTAGLKRALETLKTGAPTRVRVHGGTYRESAMEVKFDDATARQTLLVIEAAPGARVTWSGADVFAAGEWTAEGDGLFSHPWPFEFGNFAYAWGAPGVLAHRREMLWLPGDVPLRPVLLETYEVKGLARFGSSEPLSWTPRAFLDPKTTLKAGEFGVAERAENGKKVYVKLARGQTIGDVEVATRPALLNLAGKTGVVVRGIAFEKCANSDRDYGLESPLSWGTRFETANRPGDVLIENCAFNWNSGTGFQLTGWRWTMRDCEFSYNGFSGLSSGQARNVLMERVSRQLQLLARVVCWRIGLELWRDENAQYRATVGARRDRRLATPTTGCGGTFTAAR